MKGFGIATALAATAFVSSAVATTVDPIVIKGSKFFYKTNGTQFFMRGVAYQQDYTGNDTYTSTSYIDPLANASTCARDLPYLIKLQTNVIRVYAIDPTNDHSECMSMFAGAGIYVISDLSSPTQSIDRDDAEWTDDLYARYTSVVDALQNYTNTLGFFAGNEVSNEVNNTDASAFVKAAVRDTKAYIKAKGYRSIGVGYATNDDASIRVDLADYFNCGNNTADAIDFWGYNIYSWCGNSSYTESGYNLRTEEFANYSVPVFFAEYGCNTVQPRYFTEVAALYGDEMTPVWSGGIVYMYFEETNNYGLVSIVNDAVSTLADFNYLSSELAAITPTGTNSASYTPTNSAQACPTLGDDWEAEASPLPPSPNQDLCSCMYNEAACIPKTTLSDDDYADLFSTVCGLSAAACDGIAANSTTGTYGAYGMCNATEQLAFALNRYYGLQSSSASACSFGGSATIKATTVATGCSALLDEAGVAGTGSVTSSPTGTAAVSVSGTTSGSTASSSSTSSKGAASGINVQSVSFGYVGLSTYVIGAVLSGIAMIVL